jgi:hypothetical protein
MAFLRPDDEVFAGVPYEPRRGIVQSAFTGPASFFRRPSPNPWGPINGTLWRWHCLGEAIL